MVGEYMKKVLIADDELLVRVGLKSTIPWEENGFMVVGEAKNGKEAMELFEKFDPDILVTDIRMPIMNGLELIQEMKARKSKLKAVILTHYDDFSYAKEAIKLGASEYILKSDLNQDTFLAVLNKLSSDRVPFKDSYAGEIPEKVKSEDNAEILLKRLALGDYKSRQELNSMVKEFGLYFANGFCMAAAVKIFVSDINETAYGPEGETLVKLIENVSNQVLDNGFISRVFCYTGGEIIYLFNAEGIKDSKKLGETIKNQLGVLKKNVAQFLDAELSVGLSSAGVSCERIPELLEEARTAQQQCFFERFGIAVFQPEAAGKKADCPKINLDTLRNYIKTVEESRLNEYIDSVFGELLTLRNISHVKEVFIDFLSYAKIFASELNLKNEPAFNEQKLSYRNFDKMHNYEMAKKYIADIYRELLHQTDGNRSARYSYVINKSIDYIRKNYDKNISLIDVADCVQISKSYLSLLFKQETGINFSSFLTNYRIEKSKKFLKESNCKIYEIAEKVGFDNPYYFSKVFKEVTGTSCKEFKKFTIMP